jgi:dipeptide/tripeptide permease
MSQVVTRDAQASAATFPTVFWTANLTELFERAAYYSMASFVVIYLGRLGLGDYWPSTLNGLLWFLVFFLPILSGAIADQAGFRRSLLVAFVLLTAGYFLMGYPVWIGGASLAEKVSSTVTTGLATAAPLAAAILLIGLGGSVIKPTISGTVQKTHAGRSTLAFAIFYMVINVGSLIGRVVAYFVRTRWANLSFIFAVAMAASVAAFLVVLLLYREPAPAADAAPAKKRRVGEILLNMVLVLRNGRFALFLLVSSGFWFLYNQVYNVLPLYVKRVVEPNPAMDLYTAANPVTIVCFQLLITKLFGKMKPIRSIVVGTVIIGVSMAINLVPLYAGAGMRAAALWLPVGSLFIVMTVALIAFGELFTSARMYEWVGALAPKGEEGLFLGYVNLPIALGALLGGPVGAAIFKEIMCRRAVTRPDGLLDLDPASATLGWVILMAIGFASAASMWLYNRWLERHGA